ncbi:hypothetical protein E8E12_005816 [Didymella heteroderae]|uniref:Uncharacterized protein n=1 Tax=Didymella heteroderae TaxID=1769908 RepID=A0A9P5C117_9PLEO|nr:hypothetical protein E8E12_005816 [Didymella heteroderae]
MAEPVAQQRAALATPLSRQDVVSELLDDYTYDAEDVSPKSSLSPSFKELPPPPRTDSFRDPKAEAIQRMNAKFQLRVEDDSSSISSNGSRNGSVDQTPRARITSRSLSRSGTPPALQLFVSNGATAHIPSTPAGYPPVQILASNFPDSKELPPPPPERSIKRKELQAVPMGHEPSKSELERNDSFHSQNGDKPSGTSPSEPNVTAPVVTRKAIPGSGVKKFVSLLELNNGPRGGKPAPAPTSAPRKEVASKIPVQKDMPANNQLPPTPPEEASAPSPPRKALVGAGLPSNPRTKQPISPLHTRGKSSTGFNILKAQRPAPPVPTMKREVTTPEPTPSPTLKPEVRMDNEISPMKPLPSPSENRRPFSYEGPTEQGSPKQKPEHRFGQEVEQKAEQNIEQGLQANVQDEETSTLHPDASIPTPASQTSFPLRTTSVDPPEPSPSLRPSSAPAPQSIFRTTHPSLSTSTLPTNLDDISESIPQPEEDFIPLTQAPIPLPITLIPCITPSQLSCYTSHATNVWSNNIFQPMGCQICHSNENDRKFSCTWCQLRICRACSEELRMIPGRDLGRLLETREEGSTKVSENKSGEGRFTMVVEDVDLEAELDEEDEGEERGRGMAKIDSKERNGGITPRE